MKDYIEINIKNENQTTSLALAEFLLELDRCKFSEIKLIKVITGYGSHGKGGEIKKELLSLLLKLKREKQILDFMPCNKLTKEKLHNLCVDFPALITDTEISSYNSGITLVLI